MYEIESRCTGLCFTPDSVHYFWISYIVAECLPVGGKYFVNLLSVSETRVKHIVISKSTELLRVPVDRLMYISSDGNYSNVFTCDGRSRLVCMQLGQIEDLIGDQLGDNGGNFLRLGRSLIINTDYIYFIDVGKQQLILSDCSGSWHELTASREVLIKLKAYMESLMKIEINEKD